MPSYSNVVTRPIYEPYLQAVAVAMPSAKVDVTQLEGTTTNALRPIELLRTACTSNRRVAHRPAAQDTVEILSGCCRPCPALVTHSLRDLLASAVLVVV